MTTLTEQFVSSHVIDGHTLKLTRMKGSGPLNVVGASYRAYIDGEEYGEPGPKRLVTDHAKGRISELVAAAEGSLLCPWLLSPGHEGTGELTDGVCDCGFDVNTGEWS